LSRRKDVLSYEAKIIEALRRSNGNLSTLELSRKAGLPKTAVIKYLATFKMSGKADFEDVGSSRLWRLITPLKNETVAGNEELDEVLKKYMEDADLTGFAVVDREGFPLSAILPKNIAPERLGNLASLLFEVGVKSIELTDFKEFQRIIIEGSAGRVFARQEGKVLLIAFSRPDAMLGPLRLETEALAIRINEILTTRENSEKSKRKLLEKNEPVIS
jgi:predicted regulator of Ras-like GTPase activity (Roadblock/LC7/MglB family)